MRKRRHIKDETDLMQEIRLLQLHVNKYFFFYSVIGFLQVQSIQHVIVLSKVENTDVTYVTNVKNKSSILLSPKVRTYISAYENIHKNTA